MKDRLDYILSNWIFIWFIIYYFKILILPSPKFAIIIAIMLNIPILVLMIHNQENKLNQHSKHFILILTLTKIIPLLLLKNEEIKFIDIISFCILFIINIIYVSLFTGGISNCIKIFINRATNGLNGKISETILRCINKFI